MELIKQNKFIYAILLVLLLSMGHNGYVVLELLTGKKIEEPKTYWKGKAECLDSLKAFQGELRAYKAILGKMESGIIQFMYETAPQNNNESKENEISWRQ